MSEKIRVVLPKSYDLVEGDTFQLFYRGVVEAYNPYCYSIVATCEKGKCLPRYFEYAPKEVGEHKLTITVRDNNQNVLGEGETILKVVKPTAPKNPVNILILGDSLSCGGKWIKEVDRRIRSTDGTPKGLGFEGVNFVGTCKNDRVGFEAYGGWAWDTFMLGKCNAVWVECPNKLSLEDQHSVWKDIDGNLWQLETLKIDYLKFKKYGENTVEQPVGDTLYHVKNAVNTEPLKFYSCLEEALSPFFDESTGKIDFNKYLAKNNIGKVDAVYVFLGINGLMRTVAQTLSRKDYCQYVISEAKELVKYLKEGNPDLKIKITATPLPSSKGGMGSNYGAEPPFNDYYEIVNYLMELNIAYENWCLEPEYSDFMEYINMSGQFDSEYAYPYINKPVNVRSSVVERLDVNAVHPDHEGEMQIADAIFRSIIKEFCSEK